MVRQTSPPRYERSIPIPRRVRTFSRATSPKDPEAGWGGDTRKRAEERAPIGGKNWKRKWEGGVSGRRRDDLAKRRNRFTGPAKKGGPWSRVTPVTPVRQGLECISIHYPRTYERSRRAPVCVRPVRTGATLS
ncbi:hypothetical protein KM043_012134 [Ampulex compressa]|nr:hypothetical protein KM043_012134 [Ampulex compressa]